MQVEGQINSLRNDIREWIREDRSKLKSYWPIISAVLLVGWYIINLQSNANTKNLSDSISRLQVEAAASTAANAKYAEILPPIIQQNADSKRDRDDQRSRVDRLFDEVTKMQSDFASEHSMRTANEREIETQFDADSQLRNVQWATIYRRLNDMQNSISAMGGKLPATPDGPYYFPNISNRPRTQDHE